MVDTDRESTVSQIASQRLRGVMKRPLFEIRIGELAVERDALTCDRVVETIKRMLGVDEGQTTPDMLFSFETVACLGACALSPVMVVDNVYYGKTTSRRVEEALGRLMAEETGEETAR